MLTAYSLVTVVTSERTIDLALPSGLPLSDVVPQVLRYAAPDRADGGPLTWTLARMGGASLALTQTLQDAGVLDGEVLELRAQADDVRPALVEDVRDAVEDSVDAAGGAWSTRTTGSFVVLAASVTLLVLGLGGWLASSFELDGGLKGLDDGIAASTATVVLVGLTAWAGRFARDLDAQWAAGAAMFWAGLAGLDLGSALDLDLAQSLTVATAVAAGVAGLGRLLTPAATAHVAVGVVLLVAAGLQALVPALGLDGQHALRIAPVLAILVVGVLPRVSLSVGGLASADYRVRHVGQLDLAALQRRYRDSNAILVGSLVGIAVVVVVSAAVLDLGGPWDRTLALSLAGAAFLRSRLFSRTQHMVPLRAAGIAVATIVLVRFAADADADTLTFVVPVVALVAVVGLGLASLPMSEITRARVKRLLNLVEFLVVVDLLVVLVGSLDLYSKLGGII